MNINDTPAPTPISVDDRFDGLPTGNAPRTHRATKKPTGLNWGEIEAQYEANQGVRKDKIWAQGNVVIASRGGVHEQSFVERTDYEEPPIPPRPPAEEIVVPEGLDQVDREEVLTGETYEGLVDTPKPAKGPRYDYDIWTKDPEPTTEVAVPEALDDVTREDAPAGEQYDEPACPAAVPGATCPATDPQEGKTGRPRAFTSEQVDELVSRYQHGESSIELAKAFGASNATVWRTLKRAGVELRKNTGGYRPRPPAETTVTTTAEDADLQALVIADIEHRRIARGRHTHPGHDYLELLYHGLIDNLLDLKQVLLEREATQ